MGKENMFLMPVALAATEVPQPITPQQTPFRKGYQDVHRMLYYTEIKSQSLLALYKRSGRGEVSSKISYITASLLTLSPFLRARKSVQRCLISRGDTAL